MQVQTVFLSEFIYMQSSIPQTTKYQPFTYYPISVVYLGYLSIRLRYPKYGSHHPTHHIRKDLLSCFQFVYLFLLLNDVQRQFLNFL